jgi:hypothetical protein
MEEEYLDMKMRGDASGRQSLLFWHAPEQWERSAGFGFTCLIGLQLFVRMEGARQAGAANYVVTPESGRSQSLLQEGSLNLVSKNLLARSRWGHSAISQRSASFAGWCGSRREVALSWSNVGLAKTWGVPDSSAVRATVRKG